MEGSWSRSDGRAAHWPTVFALTLLILLLPPAQPGAQDDSAGAGWDSSSSAPASSDEAASEADAAAGNSAGESADEAAAGDAGWGEDGAAPASLGNPPPPPVEPSVEGLQALRHRSDLPRDAKLDSALFLRDLLARPEYQEEVVQQKPAQESWFARMLKALQRWFSGLGMGMVAGSNTATIIATVLLALLVALLIYLLVRWIWDAVSGSRIVRFKDSETAEEELEPDTLIKLAQQAMARGEVRQAIRLRFRSVLRRLPQTSAAVLLTNSQLQRRVSREFPAAAQSFGRLVICFEDAWYGGLPVAGEDYRSADGWARAVEEALPLPGSTEEAA